MSREQLIAMTRREMDNQQNNRIDLMPDVLRVPTADYYDADRWQREVDGVFKRVPLALAFSSQITQPGDFLAMEVIGVPLIIVRDNEGETRAFVNQCSHRGNYVTNEESGNVKSFRCNYHAWNYNLKGDLINILDEKNFGEVDKSCLGLTALPVAERAGMIWVTLNPKSTLDIDLFLNGYGEMLENLRLAETHVAGQQVIEGPNWKIAYDGYRDFYHLPVLHSTSIGRESTPKADYYSWGPHVRVTAPNRFEELEGVPEAQWADGLMNSGVWTIFPNISIAGGVTGPYMVSQMFPGRTPEESTTTQYFAAFESPDKLDQQGLAAYMSLMVDVVKDEDYYTGLRVQKALATGAKEYSIFGRNEGGGQLFHRWIDTLLETSDQDLPALFKDIPAHLRIPDWT